MPDQSDWPAHLRDDAPYQQCSECGRKTWATSEFNRNCGLTQPDGRKCQGRFQPDEAETDIEFDTVELLPGRKYLIRISEPVGPDALKALVTQLKATSPDSNFLCVNSQITATQFDDTGLLEQGRLALRSLDSTDIRLAANRSLYHERMVVRTVLMAMLNEVEVRNGIS